MTDIITGLYFDQLDLHSVSPEYAEQRKICEEWERQLEACAGYELVAAYEEASSQLSSLSNQYYFRKGIQVAVQLILAGKAPL